jgi:hypothetical protein
MCTNVISVLPIILAVYLAKKETHDLLPDSGTGNNRMRCG